MVARRRFLSLGARTALCILCTAWPAAAQTPGWGDKVFLSVNLTIPLQSHEFVETLSPTISGQPATVSVAHTVDLSLQPLDIGGGVRLGGNFGIGGAFTRASATESAIVRATVPHPTLAGVTRAAQLTVPMEHTETTWHAHGVWVQPLKQFLDLMIGGGLAIAFVEQQLVSGIAVEEDSPTFATVKLSEATLEKAKGHAFGFSVAADLTYFVTPMLGIGAIVRYGSASVPVTRGNGGTVTIDTGGLQVGVGGRIRIR